MRKDLYKRRENAFLNFFWEILKKMSANGFLKRYICIKGKFYCEGEIL